MSVAYLLTVGYLCRRDKNTKTLYLLKSLLIAKIFDENFRPACINTLLSAVFVNFFGLDLNWIQLYIAKSLVQN